MQLGKQNKPILRKGKQEKNDQCQCECELYSSNVEQEGEGDTELKEGTEQGGVNQRKPTS